MEELIFFGLIIFFSILDGIARKRRGQAGPVEAPPEEWSEPELRVPTEAPSRRVPESPRVERLPTYDEDPSFDDDVDAGARGGAGQGSEAMVPADIWDEIARLARGESPAPKPAPPPRRDTIEPARRFPRLERASVSTGPPRRVPTTTPAGRPAGWRPDHPVHRSHELFGTDPSERASSLPPEGGPAGSPAARAVREMLGSGSAGELRKAVILREVLGPPAAYRGDPFDGPG